MSKIMKMFFFNNEKENYFSTHFKGPKLNFSKAFNLDFKYFDIFNIDNAFNSNLRNNVYEQFSKINSVCN